MQSEFACHIGLKGKYFCRICEVKGHDSSDRRPSGADPPDDGNNSDASTLSTQRTGRKLESMQELVDRASRFIQVCLFTYYLQTYYILTRI